jgi:hypothetical protein
MAMIIMAMAAALAGGAAQESAPAWVLPPPPVPIASSPPDVPLGAIGTWTAYGQDQKLGICGVSRNYGSLDAPAGIAFEASIGQSVQIYLLSKGGGNGEAAGDGGVALEPGTRADAVYRGVDAPARGLRLEDIIIVRDAFDGLAAAKTMTIRTSRTMTIPAEDVKAALAALSACRNRMFVSWGLNPKLIDFDHPMPNGSQIAGWFSYDDYPAAARRASITGRVVMALDVGGDGLIKACRVVVSAAPVLDETSCALAIKRGHLPPRPHARANAIVSQMLVPVRWSLQD